MQNYVITIARGFGSGGKEIASKLSERLNIPCYDRQILTMASQFSGIDESEFVEVNEKLRGAYLSKLIRSVPFSTMVEPTERDFVSDNNLFNIQAQIIRNLSKTESCIIVGKCADYVLKKYSNTVSLYIEAPQDECIQSIVNKMNVTEERAAKLIKTTDKYRSNYYKYYTYGKEWKNPDNYDMVLNTGKIGRNKCVDLIEDYIKIKFCE